MKQVGLVIAAGVVVLVGLAAVIVEREWHRDIVLAAVGPIRTVNAACRAYADMYPALGFPRRLDQLGSPSQGQSLGSEHSGLVDDVLAAGRRSGYDFSYVAKTGTDGRAVAYTLLVRPHVYGENGKRSYFTNQTGVIRFTDENRPASGSDSLLK